MDELTHDTFERLGITVLLGMLIGLQRQHSETSIAGLRTFPIFALLGSLTVMIDQQISAGGWVVLGGFIAVALVILVSQWRHMIQPQSELGLTTEAAILVVYAIGVYMIVGERLVAVVIGAGIAVLLQFKTELHGISARLGDDDLRAIMKFVLITCIILPILPNQTYDLIPPLNVLNPFETWLMVVLMVGISLGGYLAYKFFGRGAGIIFGGMLGGAISSTATTVSYAKRASQSIKTSSTAALIILIASSVVFVRVILEVAVVAPSHVRTLSLPIAVMLVSSILTAGIAWLRVRKAGDFMPEHKNPTELGSAVVFACLYVGVTMALSLAKKYFADQGIYAVALFSGLTDMDAITLSTARMVQRGGEDSIGAGQAWRLIVIASMSNLFFKALIVAGMGPRQLFRSVLLYFAVPMIVGGLLLAYWP